jgi:hypothetical protein
VGRELIKLPGRGDYVSGHEALLRAAEMAERSDSLLGLPQNIQTPDDVLMGSALAGLANAYAVIALTVVTGERQ